MEFVHLRLPVMTGELHDIKSELTAIHFNLPSQLLTSSRKHPCNFYCNRIIKKMAKTFLQTFQNRKIKLSNK